MSFFGTHRSSSSVAKHCSGVRQQRRRLTVVLAVGLAFAVSGLIAAVPATANPVGVATGESGHFVKWGYSANGDTASPTGLTNVTAIAGGLFASLALKSDGTVVAWGDNEFGALDVPDGLSGVTAIASGYNHSLALQGGGTAVVAWGLNNHGQATVPEGLTDVTAIAAGGQHSLALKSDGTVVAWGFNDRGQATVPEELTDVAAIAAGEYFSLALKRDGTVVGWGSNDSGQLTVPDTLSGVTAIAAGSGHSLALRADGTVVAWGEDDFGQAMVPAGLSGVTAIAAGYHHSLALKSDGTVIGWGRDSEGQATSPTDLTGVVAIAAGGLHSLALVHDSGPPVFTADSPPNTVQAGVPVSYTFAASGTPAATFAVSAGDLPAGLSLSAAGVLSGTSTVTGLSSFTVTASNGHLPDTAGESHAIEVTPGPVEAVSIAPQSAGSTTYTATAGAALPFSSSGADQWGNPVVGQAVIITTDNTGGINPDLIRGNTVTIYNAGVHLVTTTIGGVSTTVSVTTVPGVPVMAAVASSALQVALGGSINLSMSGLDAYGNVIDLTSQAVFTSDWAVDVISGSTVTFPHASPHVITGRVGALTSTTTIEVISPTDAASTAAAGSASALAFTGINPLPAMFGGLGALLVGVLLSGAAWSRRRPSTRS